ALLLGERLGGLGAPGPLLGGGCLTPPQALRLGGELRAGAVLKDTEGLHPRPLTEEAAGVVGDDDLTQGGHTLALVLADDEVTDLATDLVEAPALTLLVGSQGLELGGESLELQGGVVVTLLRLLGLVVEPFDPIAHVVDVGLGL